jgi:hypothetical protein
LLSSEFAVLPPAWIALLPGRVTITVIRMFLRKKKTNAYEREQLFFTSSIDRVRDMTLPTPAQVDKFLIEAARDLLVGHRNRESDILVERKQKNWLKLTKSIRYTCQPLLARCLRPIH